MVQYGKPYEKPEAKPESNQPKVKEDIRQDFGNTVSKIEQALPFAPLGPISLTAILGWVGGVTMMLTGVTVSADTSIAQIYQMLCIGQGGIIVIASSIAQHTKGTRMKRD